MKIKKLSLVHFKNHHDFQIDIDKDIVAIAGLNGVGKTTVLDAIHFLCVGKSYFSGTDVQCINTEENVAGILATLINDEETDVKIKFKRGSRKRIERNGALYKVLDHIGHYFSVVIAPGDIELIYGSNDIRRSFIDQILSQTNHNYLLQLLKYKKLLEHRNKHLKQEVVDHALLETLDDQMSPLAQNIYLERKVF
ncbi:MAG: AAA family ATPase, partial [Bacteroidia bacterium]|nr:AAA family ATPase [Bacteroidia bacterium]NNJ56562.1 DNA replication/repair protein RecF [Bacteroidia bacterium]